MKTRQFLYALPLLLASCNSYFDPEGLYPEEKLVLYCMPNPNQDSIVIQLSKSVPVTATGTPPLGIPKANIDFMVNGEKQHVYWNENRTENLPPQCYYVLNNLKEGDKIEIFAGSRDLTPVTSSTVIPTSFPLEDIELAIKPEDTPKLQFRVTFRDNASTDDYYGIRIVEKVITEHKYDDENGVPCDTTVEITSVLNFDVTDEPLLNDRVGLDATFELDYDYYQNLYIWTDEKIPGKEYTLRLTSSYTPDYESDEASEYGYYKAIHLYKVYLYHLSPEFYRYLKSVNAISNNELGQNGLAPIRSHYSNILNGFGILGGCQFTESSWLPQPQP